MPKISVHSPPFTLITPHLPSKGQKTPTPPQKPWKISLFSTVFNNFNLMFFFPSKQAKTGQNQPLFSLSRTTSRLKLFSSKITKIRPISRQNTHSVPLYRTVRQSAWFCTNHTAPYHVSALKRRFCIYHAAPTPYPLLLILHRTPFAPEPSPLAPHPSFLALRSWPFVPRPPFHAPPYFSAPPIPFPPFAPFAPFFAHNFHIFPFFTPHCDTILTFYSVN